MDATEILQYTMIKNINREYNMPLLLDGFSSKFIIFTHQNAEQ